MSTSEKVSLNAKQIILAIIISTSSITALVAGGSIISGNPEIAEKISIAFVSGIIGFGAGIVTALWGK
jgi:hypothetical protein